VLRRRWQRCGSVDLLRKEPVGEGGGRIGCGCGGGGWPEEREGRRWRMAEEKMVEASTEYGGGETWGSDYVA